MWPHSVGLLATWRNPQFYRRCDKNDTSNLSESMCYYTSRTVKI